MSVPCGIALQNTLFANRTAPAAIPVPDPVAKRPLLSSITTPLKSIVGTGVWQVAFPTTRNSTYSFAPEVP